MKKEQKRLGNKGFSIVELIVVIAIMAVLIAILAPTLIGKIEESRESKDIQALDTVANSLVIVLGNKECYKELVPSTGTATYTIALDSTITFKSKTASASPSVTPVAVRYASVAPLTFTLAEGEGGNVTPPTPSTNKSTAQLKDIVGQISFESDAAEGATIEAEITSKGKVTVSLMDEGGNIVEGDSDIVFSTAQNQAEDDDE